MKNQKMKEAGIHVPDTFEHMPAVLQKVYNDLVKKGTIKPKPEPEVAPAPRLPVRLAVRTRTGRL